jgi:hypothetical protein
LRLPGIGMLLRIVARARACRRACRNCRDSWKRGVVAFRQLGDVDAFLSEIQRSERAIGRAPVDGDPDPFAR